MKTQYSCAMGIALAIACATGLGVAAQSAEPKPAAGEPSLAELRSATERFRDIKVALAEGYVPAPMDMCETAEGMGQPAKLGAMGVHYFRPDLLGITATPPARVNGNGTHVDFRKPAVLIYEPTDKDGLELVAIENLVFQASWRAAGHAAPPTFYGVPFEAMQDNPSTALDEAHMFAPHFDRHVWLYRSNPNGIFAPFNPAVSCAHAKGGHNHPAHQ